MCVTLDSVYLCVYLQVLAPLQMLGGVLVITANVAAARLG